MPYICRWVVGKPARLIIRLLLIQYLTNSTNLQIVRRQCCLVDWGSWLCHAGRSRSSAFPLFLRFKTGLYNAREGQRSVDVQISCTSMFMMSSWKYQCTAVQNEELQKFSQITKLLCALPVTITNCRADCRFVESTSPDSCCRVVFCYHIVASCVVLHCVVLYCALCCVIT